MTIAIPVLNGGELFARSLAAISGQRVGAEVELLVVDSGSTDGSRERAREHGARVIEIPRSEFGHGSTRNLLLEQARGSHVALITQDAEPASEDWLELLLGGFEQAADVALVFGPYSARSGASTVVRLELERWFGSLTPGLERLSPEDRIAPDTALMGRRGFFSDANACVLRAAWERVRYREVSYAEDRALALDMLRAGYAKVYEPRAAVIHSHDYGPLEQFGRAFDEGRGVYEVYRWREPLRPRYIASQVRGEIASLRREGAPLAAQLEGAATRLIRVAGAIVGSRADRLTPSLLRLLSRDARAGRDLREQ